MFFEFFTFWMINQITAHVPLDNENLFHCNQFINSIECNLQSNCTYIDLPDSNLESCIPNENNCIKYNNNQILCQDHFLCNWINNNDPNTKTNSNPCFSVCLSPSRDTSECRKALLQYLNESIKRKKKCKVTSLVWRIVIISCVVSVFGLLGLWDYYYGGYCANCCNGVYLQIDDPYDISD